MCGEARSIGLKVPPFSHTPLLQSSGRDISYRHGSVFHEDLDPLRQHAGQEDP